MRVSVRGERSLLLSVTLSATGLVGVPETWRGGGWLGCKQKQWRW